MRQEFGQSVRNLPITKLLHLDPFTKRTFEKPCGYAGDATMLDYIYGPVFFGAVQVEAQVLDIFLYTTHGPSCRAVRYRKEYLTWLIDRVASGASAPRIAAIACGHLREAAGSRALNAGRIDEFIAIDQDEESLITVKKDYSHLGVVPIKGTVRDLITGKICLENLDLIYAAGLYDYLPTPAAKALTKKTFQSLRPGGRLLIANFLPGIQDCGYMEFVMDWHLIFRTDEEMIEIASEIESSAIESTRIWHDPDDNIVFLEIRRNRNLE